MHYLYIFKDFILHLRQIQSYSMNGLCTGDQSVSESVFSESIHRADNFKKTKRPQVGNKNECDGELILQLPGNAIHLNHTDSCYECFTG